jgi:hypothetical protein
LVLILIGLNLDVAAELPIAVTHHHNLYVPTQWTGEVTTWGAFVEQLTAAGHRQDVVKEHAPLVSLYSLRPGGKRCTADVQAVFGICLDFDDVPLAYVLDAVTRLQAENIALLAYTTWRHPSPSGERWRLIIPLAVPIAAAQYNAVLAHVWAHFAEHADRDADGVSRGFFVPSAAPERAEFASIFALPGVGLPLPTLHAVPALIPPVAEPPVRLVQFETWTMLGKRWRKAQQPRVVDLGNRFSNVLLGASFAQPSERDVILWDLISAIAKAYPDVSSDAVWELFRHSIDRMASEHPEGAKNERDVREKLERARGQLAAEADAHMPYDRKEAIRQAFGSDRETPYTPDELANISELTGLSQTQLDRSWILQHESDYYIIGLNGRLVTAQREALLNTCRVVLAPAPIDLHTIDKTGRRLKSTGELLEAHSLPITEVRRSLVANVVKFDLPARAITLPACSHRNLAARYSADIDAWLQRLAGERYLDLIGWLAHVPDLAHPLTGLVLTGPKSVGKSLLAMGLSRLWCTTGPSKLADAMGDFNATLERCPMVHADEAEIPKDVRGVERTGDLREFVQSTQRLVNEKFRRQVTLEGAARLQISANNENVFSLHADLTDHDLDAIAERFTHIRCSPLAAEYLEAKGGREGIASWIEGDGLPAHVLWLAEQHGNIWRGRFGVESDSNCKGLADTLAVRSGVRSKICELVVRVLSNTEPLADGAYVIGKELIVHLDWVLRHWELLLGKGRPATSAIIQALEGLGERLESADGLIYFVLSTRRLEAWAFESGFGTAARVENWLVLHGS